MLKLNSKIDLLVQEKFNQCFQPFVDKVKTCFEEVDAKLVDLEFNLRNTMTDFRLDIVNNLDQQRKDLDFQIKKIK